MPIKYIALGLAILGVIAGAYFAITAYNNTMKENAKLKIEISSVKAQKDQMEKDYKNIVSTVDKNETMTHQVTEKTNTIIREIQSAPVTTQCVSSPSIGIAIDRLKQQKAAEVQPK